MNTLDLFILIPIGIGAIFGLFKGAVKEIISLIAIALGLIISEMFSKQVAALLEVKILLNPNYSIIIAYILIFLAVIIVSMLIGKIIEKIISGLSLKWLNLLLGTIFGALKIAIVVSILMNVLNTLDTNFHFIDEEKKKESVTYYPILKLSPTLWDAATKQYNNTKF